jgi:hypothetical protein
MRQPSTKKRIFIFFSGCILSTSQGIAAANPSQQIDLLVESRLKELAIEPNAPTTDAQFVRRAYLDIVGRIPSLEETRKFLAIENPAKRTILISLLLQSEGHVSHSFNQWADILRAKSESRDISGAAYVNWIKQALRENRSYRDFVTELVTAEGQTWENPAVGFYLRDRGMPLDHMAYTAQIFLAKAMVCAQCHDHPFDDISQMQFYQMAAFTYGVSTSLRPQAVLGLDKTLNGRKSRGTNARYGRHIDQAAQTLLAPIAAGVEDSERALVLPHDYENEDASPGDKVRPDTLFGDQARGSRGKKLRRAYADWMTDPENDRFTKVIANRLWHRVMGRGLLEPIDDFKDASEPSHPELLDFLIREMKRLNYDQRAFLSILYNTRTYQRQATSSYVSPGEDYHFAGPLLRRMSAEQLWDSLLTLTIPDPDGRSAAGSNARRLEAEQQKAKVIVESKKPELVDAITGLADILAKLDDDTAGLRGQLSAAIEAKDQPKINAIRREIRTFERASQSEQNRYIAAFYGGDHTKDDDPLSMMRMNTTTMQGGQMMQAGKGTADGGPAAQEDDPWRGFAAGLVRASELSSPAPAGHFLRQFGQSDREVIANANNETSSDQALSLMNGDVFRQITGEQAVLMQNVNSAATPEEKLEVVFMSMLGRPATEMEIRRLDALTENATEHAYPTIIWALLNTSEFSFIQ